MHMYMYQYTRQPACTAKRGHSPSSAPPRRCLGRSSEPLERAASAGANVTAFGPLGTFGHAGAISLARVMTLAWQLSTEDQLDMYHQLSASLKQHGHLS